MAACTIDRLRPHGPFGQRRRSGLEDGFGRPRPTGGVLRQAVVGCNKGLFVHLWRSAALATRSSHAVTPLADSGLSPKGASSAQRWCRVKKANMRTMEPGRLCKRRQDAAPVAYRASFPGFARLAPLFFYSGSLDVIHIGLDEGFGDLHRIQGRPLAQIVGHHP